MATEKRRLAIIWWNNTLSEKQAEELAKKYSELLHNRPYSALTGREIELIYENEQNKPGVEKENITLMVIQRVLAFPFFFCIALIATITLFCAYIVNFIRFGGESIAYTSKTRRKTIYDVFVKLSENQNNEND